MSQTVARTPANRLREWIRSARERLHEFIARHILDDRDWDWTPGIGDQPPRPNRRWRGKYAG